MEKKLSLSTGLEREDAKMSKVSSGHDFWYAECVISCLSIRVTSPLTRSDWLYSQDNVTFYLNSDILWMSSSWLKKFDLT